MGRRKQGRGAKFRADMRNHISRLVSKESHKDQEKKESINVLNDEQIARSVARKFGRVDWRMVDEYDKGLVLSDGRGEGHLQKRE